MFFNKLSQMKFLLIFLYLLIISEANAQTGIIKGIVVEKKTNETIPGANIWIEGSTVGTSSDLEGKFVISAVNPGTYNIKVSFISYETITKENITVLPNQTIELKIELEQVGQMLKGIDIVARVQRDRENILLMEQKRASAIVQRIGSQEISRKGVSDVAGALTKVTGISKIEGSNDIFVRGLGDRYNSSSINGLPIPSNNPEYKNISLDIISTDIVEFINIDKVYNNKIFGDFAGGNVNIVTKDFDDDNFFKFEIGSKINFNTINENNFQVKGGHSAFGFSTTKPVESISEFDFENSLNPISVMPLGKSFSLTSGYTHKFGKEKQQRISLYGGLSFDNEFSAKEGIAMGTINNAGVARKDFRMKTMSSTANTTAMFNLGYSQNKNNRVNYNFFLINNASNSSETYRGTIIDIADNNNGLMIRRIFDRNTIIINQLLGKHTFSKTSEFEWGVSYNTVTNDAPDRLQNTFRKVGSHYLLGQNQITDNHRYFHRLKENEVAANLNYSHRFLALNENEYKIELNIGSSTRYKTVDFNSTQYNFRILGDHRNDIVDPYNLDNFFNQQNLENGFFRIETFRGNFQVPNALDPQVYSGTQFIQGTYLTTILKPTEQFTAILGIRNESISQEIFWNTQLDPSDRNDLLEIFDFLPSITTKYELNKKQNLRFAASKTYTLPQFKERALFIYEEVTEVKLGNPDLYQSDNYNVDLKWEFFPKTSEVISVAAFGKYILNPINEFAITSATNDISYINTGDWGYVTGLEFEIRKEIFSKNNSKLFAGFNSSYMHTEQELNSEKIQEETIYMVNFTHERARFTGASDLLINADISYSLNWNNDKNNILATISYNYFSDRIYAIGTNGRGNIIEKPFNTLDFIIKTQFENLEIGLNIKNILNPAIERFQANENANALVTSYKKGIISGIKMSYKF